MYQKFNLNKILLCFSITLLAVCLTPRVFASEQFSGCPYDLSNIPTTMATSCNNISLGTITVNVPITGNKTSISGSAKVDLEVTLGNIPLLKYFNSVSSSGDSSNPFTPYGYYVEKTSYNPYINYNMSSSNLPGTGGFSLPSSCGAGEYIGCSITSSDQAQNIFFPVPDLGKAADLFTIGSFMQIDNSQGNNLPNPNIETSTPVDLTNNNNLDCYNQYGNYNIYNNTQEACDLIGAYGDPYNLTNEIVGTTLQSYFINVLKSVWNFILNVLNLGNLQNVSPGGYCSNTVTVVNTTDATNTGNVAQNPSTYFNVNVSASCPSSYTSKDAISVLSCWGSLESDLATGTVSVTIPLSSNLYLEGLNSVLADEWYTEASLDGGPPIGHTTITAWKKYVNSSTGYLNANTQSILEAGPSNPQYNTVYDSLFTGVGISVPLSNIKASTTNTNAPACTSTGSGEGSASFSYNPSASDFYFPWVGEATIMEQNLSSHNFQPYYQENSAVTSSTSGVDPLPPGEYYISDPSNFPDPLLLYLIYTGSLSLQDPIVLNALQGYNPYACLGNNLSSGANVSSQFNLFNPSACTGVLDKTVPTTVNLSASYLLNDASAFIGDQYLQISSNEAKSTPACTQGVDCSGLAQIVYADSGISIPRTTETQYSYTDSNLDTFTDPSLVAPGDLVFFFVQADMTTPCLTPGSYSIYSSSCTPQHVAIVDTWNGINDFSVIEAANPSLGVIEDSYTNFPTCFASPSELQNGTFEPNAGMCIVGFAKPAVGQFY